MSDATTPESSGDALGRLVGFGEPTLDSEQVFEALPETALKGIGAVSLWRATVAS